MWRLNARLRPAIALHFATHFAFFFIVSWLLLSLVFKFDPVSVTAATFLLTVASMVAEWITGPNLVESLLKPRWMRENDDPVLWSLVQGEASKAGVRIEKIGIVEVDSPNALIIASPSGQLTLVFTRGLLCRLTFPEVRAASAYLMGASKSGFLGFSTTFSGLLAISYRFAGGYIESRVEGRKGEAFEIVLAALGYLIFAFTAPLTVIASRPMSLYGDEYSITQTRDPASFLTMLLKVADGIARKTEGPSRTFFTPLKGLMLLDPTIAIRDSNGLVKAAQSNGIDTSRLLGGPMTPKGEGDEIEFHAFERFWSQPRLIDRFWRTVSLGKGVKTPIKVGLSWIE
jgi:Zn-dependent protease with chaperone function